MSLCGSGTRNSHNDQFYVLVCLGQDAQLFGPARCYCGHEALEDAANIKPADDLVLCRWVSTSRLKPLDKESFLREQTFCLQKSLWTQDCGTSCFQGQFADFSLWISGLPAPNTAEANSNRYLPLCPELCNNSLLLSIILC